MHRVSAPLGSILYADVKTPSVFNHAMMQSLENLLSSKKIIFILELRLHFTSLNNILFHFSRQKRVSDQRLAELETLLALEKIRGQLVTVPVAFGRVDPAKM